MARVRDERAHLLLVVLTRRERGVDVIEEGIERGAHLPRLGVRISLRGGDAFGDRDGSFRQRELSDAGCGVGNRPQRSQRLPDNKSDRRAEHAEPGDRHDEDHPDDPRERRVLLREREPDDDAEVAVTAHEGSSAKGTVVADGDCRELLLDDPVAQLGHRVTVERLDIAVRGHDRSRRSPPAVSTTSRKPGARRGCSRAPLLPYAGTTDTRVRPAGSSEPTS